MCRCLLLAAAVLLSVSTASAQTATEGETLPESVMKAEIRALDGKTFTLSDGEEKLRIIILWAAWCGPCRLAVEAVNRERAIYAQRGAQVIGLTIDDVKDEKAVRRFIRKGRIAFKIGWAGDELAVPLSAERKIVPQILVITKDGRVVTRFVGYYPASTLIKLRNAVESNLAAVNRR